MKNLDEYIKDIMFEEATAAPSGGTAATPGGTMGMGNPMAPGTGDPTAIGSGDMFPTAKLPRKRKKRKLRGTHQTP